MRFPKDCIAQVQYREGRRDALVKTVRLEAQANHFISKFGTLKLMLGNKQHALNPLLLRVMGPDIFIENLSLNLISTTSKKDPISIHSSIPNSTSYRLFKQGFQSSSISNFRSYSDPNAWRYHHTSSASNPEQLLSDSLYKGTLGKKLQLFPSRGHFNSDGMVCLEEICHQGHKEWGSEIDQIPIPPRRIIFYASRPGQQFVRFFVHLDPKKGCLREFNVIWDFSGRLLSHQGRVSLTPLSWTFENLEAVHKEARLQSSLRRTGSHFILDHQKKIARSFHAKLRPKNHIAAWCVKQGTKPGFELIKRNLEAAANHNLKLNYFIVSACTTCDEQGVHISSSSEFSLEIIAKEIERYGFKPAIRVAPFLVPYRSEFIQNHPEMILRLYKSDKPVIYYDKLLKIKYYCLDPTHPRFRSWIKKSISGLVKNGFKTIYLDNLTLTTLRANYHNNQSSGAGRLRESLLWIKRAAGWRTRLISSDCPLWPAIGLVDVMQVSQESGQRWQSTRLHKIIGGKAIPATRKSMINTINHSGMHNQFWVNAPGPVAIFQNHLTQRQRTMMLSILALSGSSLLLSDDLSVIAEEELVKIRYLLSVNKECCAYTPLPLMMFEKHFPRGLYNPAGYLGIWNPTEHSERIELIIPENLGMQNFRSKLNLVSKYKERVAYRLESDRFSIALSPYETVVIKL